MRFVAFEISGQLVSIPEPIAVAWEKDRKERDEARSSLARVEAEAKTNRARYEGALSAIPVVTAKLTAEVKRLEAECSRLREEGARAVNEGVEAAAQVVRGYAAVNDCVVEEIRALKRPSPATSTEKQCPVPNCHAGMLREATGLDSVSCPVCDGTITVENYLRSIPPRPASSTGAVCEACGGSGSSPNFGAAYACLSCGGTGRSPSTPTPTKEK